MRQSVVSATVSSARVLLILLIGSVLGGRVAHAETTLRASVDRTRVTLFERVTYTIEVASDSRNRAEPQPPEFKGFKVMGPPRTSSQFSWVNGVTSNVMSYSYVLEAREEGRHVWEPASMVVDGEVIRSAPVEITVLKPGAPPPAEGSNMPGLRNMDPDRLQSLFIETVVDDETPFVGQAVRVSYHVFTRVSIRNFGIQDEPDYQGFWVEPVDLPAQPALNSRVIEGIEYKEAKIHEVILYPTVSGELMIPPLRMVFEFQDRRQDPFDSFFNSPFGSGMFGVRQESRSTSTTALQVRPLPEEGKPPGFSGAVGLFKLEAELKNPSVKAGEAITMTVTLRGNHGLKTIGTPVAPDLPRFKVFDPKAGEVAPDPQEPGWWKRSFDYVLVAHEPGEYTIPGFTFSYFDTGTESYQTLKTPDVSVSVAPAPGGNLPLPYSPAGRELTLLNADVRYIKTADKLSNQVEAYRSSWFAVMMVIPVILIPSLLLLDARRRRLEGDTAFAREVRARSGSGRRFAEAISANHHGDVSKALDETAAGFARYLSDRLGLPTGGITLGTILGEMNLRSIPETHIQNVRQYWETLETARYGPVDVSGTDIEDLIRKGQALVDQLEKIRMNSGSKGKSGRKAGAGR